MIVAYEQTFSAGEGLGKELPGFVYEVSRSHLINTFCAWRMITLPIHHALLAIDKAASLFMRLLVENNRLFQRLAVVLSYLKPVL